ncbi:metallophosphoesterase [Candidatus Bipolaricaulota bacterium]|nr:metallophosphoesterase [Candidatus Bipolaricaulota bacterium]
MLRSRSRKPIRADRLRNRRGSCTFVTSVLTAFLVMICVASPGSTANAETLRIGVIADVHAHDLDSPIEGKWMSHTETRLMQFVNAMNGWPADLVVQLGDFVNGWIVLGIDPGDPSRIPGILAWADGLLAAFQGPRLHVLGNHDVYNLDKSQIRTVLGLENTYDSLDANGFHLVILDVQFDEQGDDLSHTYTGVAGFAPGFELQWLREDLAASDLPTVIFVHQRIEAFVEAWGRPLIANAEDLRQILVEDGDVVAVFQGHDHANHHSLMDGIHYVTFEALVDQGTPPSWAAVTLDSSERTLVIEGVGEQESYDFTF